MTDKHIDSSGHDREEILFIIYQYHYACQKWKYFIKTRIVIIFILKYEDKHVNRMLHKAKNSGYIEFFFSFRSTNNPLRLGLQFDLQNLQNSTDVEFAYTSQPHQLL